VEFASTQRSMSRACWWLQNKVKVDIISVIGSAAARAHAHAANKFGRPYESDLDVTLRVCTCAFATGTVEALGFLAQFLYATLSTTALSLLILRF